MGYKTIGEQEIDRVTEDHPTDYLLFTKGTVVSTRDI